MRRVVLAADSNRSLRSDRGFSESWFDESTADVIFREDQIHHPFLLWRLWILQRMPPEGNLILVGGYDFGSGGIVHKGAAPLHVMKSGPNSTR
jgi:hypothetical protein